MVLLHLAVSANFRADVWLVENLAVVEALGFPVIDRFTHVELVNAADHFIDRAEAKLCHRLAKFFRDVFHEVDDCFGITVELLTKLRVLRGNAYRASVLVADAHHQATQCNQCSGREAELFGTKQAGDGNIAACLKLTVCFNHNA